MTDLSLGRKNLTIEEVRRTWGFNEHRKALIDEFERFISALRPVVPICSAWMAGSFISSKPYPEDIDTTLWIDGNQVEALQRVGRLLTEQGLQQLQQTLGTRLDVYVVPWVYFGDSKEALGCRSYLAARGYWDDWWQRRRLRPKGHSQPRESGLPARGYVEVIYDGYT